MTERERLIELLKNNCSCRNEDCAKCGCGGKCFTHREADYLLANGVIVPPCKVGDTVYAMKGCFYLPHATRIKSTDMIPCEIIVIKQTKRNKFILLKPLIEESFGMRSANCWFSFSSLGVTVFLTKEEAEKALEGK